MAEFEGYTGVWRRLKSGAAIFIRDGEDIKKAVRRNFNSKKLIEKSKELKSREERAFEFEQLAKRDKLIAFREKGELSDKYDEAVRTERAWKKEQDRLRQERYDVDDENLRVTSRNQFGMQIKKDQFDRLKEVGQVNKNTADLENSIIAHKETRAKINKVGVQNASTELISKDLANEIGMNEFKNKYFRFYGYDAMKDVETDTIKSLDKATLGKAQTNKFKAEVSSKPTISDVRKELRNMESWNEEKQYGDIVISKTGHTGYHVRNINDVSDPQTDYFAGVYGFKEKQVLNLLKERGYVQQEEVKTKVQNYRNRKGNVRQNNSGYIENLSKQALIEKLVDDQISRGVVRAENRQLQIDARKNMTKTELLKYFK